MVHSSIVVKEVCGYVVSGLPFNSSGCLIAFQELFILTFFYCLGNFTFYSFSFFLNSFFDS
jgi:hypothetical protein